MRGRCVALGVGRETGWLRYLPNTPSGGRTAGDRRPGGDLVGVLAPISATRSVVDRFAQIAPVVLVAMDGYRYGGRAQPGRAVGEIVNELAELAAVSLVDTRAPRPSGSARRPGRGRPGEGKHAQLG